MCGTTDVTSDGLTEDVLIKYTLTPNSEALILSLGADLSTSDFCDMHADLS